MEALEIEISYLQELIDDEVMQVLQQFLLWQDLQDCALVFDINVSNIKEPMEVLPDLIMRKADEHLPQAKAHRFKALWQQLNMSQQMLIVFALHNS